MQTPSIIAWATSIQLLLLLSLLSLLFLPPSIDWNYAAVITMAEAAGWSTIESDEVLTSPTS